METPNPFKSSAVRLWKALFGNSVLAKSGLALLKANAPQPHCQVNVSALVRLTTSSTVSGGLPIEVCVLGVQQSFNHAGIAPSRSWAVIAASDLIIHSALDFLGRA
jgi:hypothetical protein